MSMEGDGSKSKLEELPNSEASSSGNGPGKQQSSPFDDPIERTRWLIRYIRLRKRRAEDELAKQNELKRKKKDARATLQSALSNLEASREEVVRGEQRLEELNAERHRIL